MLYKRLHLFVNKLLFTMIAIITFSNTFQKKIKYFMMLLGTFLSFEKKAILYHTFRTAICASGFLLTGLYSNQTQAQNCTTLYVITGNDGRVYSVNTATGAKTLVTTMTTGRSNVAVGPDPASLGSTVFTTSQMTSGSTVYKSNASIATTLPVQVNGLTTNPATTGTTAGFVYGISAARQLIKASPAPAANLGTITGDAVWNGGTMTGDGFFNNADELFTVVISGSSDYLYKINTTTLVATQMVQLSGSLPGSYHGIAFLNGKIYVGEAYTKTTGIIITIKTNEIQLYEINPNTGQSVEVGVVDLGSAGSFLGIGGTSYPDIDFASCDVYIPATGPTCNELFGIVAANQSVYRINLTTLATTLVTDGTATTPQQGNVAFGPVPANLNQNQFITSPNNALGNIYKDVNGTGTLTTTTSTWGSPIGLGTDPATGIVYGITSKILSRWTGTGNGALVGTTGLITGDAIWTGGTTLNDIAVDAGGNLYCIVFSGANTYLYRIDPTTLTAKLVVQATGTFITNGTTTNGNGLAYLGDYFYYSRINGANTDIWRISACTGGVSTFVGSVTGVNFGDLASCATVTCVPADFNFDCGATGAGLQQGNLAATGASQTNVLRVPINATITGLAGFTLAGTGITTSPSPYVVTLAQGATFVDIPFTFDGSGTAGTRTITVTSTVGIGTCLIAVPVDPCAAGTVAPILSASSKANICPATTIDLTTITAGNMPVGATLTFHTGTPATAANQVKAGNPVPDSSAVPAGTYYAAFYDAANNCYSGTAGSATTIITATSTSCTPPVAGQCVNVLTNPSFESPVQSATNANNIITGLTFNGWTASANTNANPFNIIKVDGTGYSVGPDKAADGIQYVDIVGSAIVTQTFTVPTGGAFVKYSGSYANRETSGGYSPSYNYITLLNSSGTIVGTSSAVDLIASVGEEKWFSVFGFTGTRLPAGTYTYKVVIGNFTHFDNASVCLQTDAPAGTIDCAKTQISSAPVFGTAGQKTLSVTANITTAGCFGPLIVSGSGISLPDGFTQLCTNTTGVQTFSIPVNYDGSALSTMSFILGALGTCTADLTKAPKKALCDIWTLECVPTAAPSLK